ncbi:MAG: hypothetical protein COV75_03470 [Candidatus Omnitrophica bacterium CG11_big_fil_rev_8_21_14_0_20_63_9]|nr:MAG: hypothetical protein COV75_03470 [Candidatus Omnitrophica bacterium CG11_big_fil_rev_8_21_14_0_20_63_9]
MDENSGMLIKLDLSKGDTMDMTDMLFDLDMLWISPEDVIVHVAKNVSKDTPKKPIKNLSRSPGKTYNASHVLEVNAGYVDQHQIKIGDKLIRGGSSDEHGAGGSSHGYIAPVIAIAGVDFNVMKFLAIAGIVAVVWMGYKWLRNRKPYRVLGAGLVVAVYTLLGIAAPVYAQDDETEAAQDDKERIGHLIKQLDSVNRDTRMTAAKALGKIRDPIAVRALNRALRDKEWGVRAEAAQALGEIGTNDELAVLELIEALKDEVQPVRASAAAALGKIGDERAVPALIDLMRRRWPYRLTEAEDALVKIGKASVPELIKLLQNNGFGEERWQVARALGRIGDSRAMPALTETLKDDSDHVRSAAVGALIAIGEPVVPVMITIVNDNGNREEARISALRVLMKIGNRESVPVLVLALLDQGNTGNIGGEIADALGDIGDKRAVLALVHVLRDNGSKGYTRIAAAGALYKLKREPETEDERIFYLLAKSDLQELAKIGRSAVPLLIEILKNSPCSVAVEALGEIGDKRAVEVLIAELRSSSINVFRDYNIAAAKALGKIGDKRAIPALIEASKDGNGALRRSAVESLGKIGDQQAVPMLIEALEDHSEDIRRSAVDALVRIKEPAVPALITVLREGDEVPRSLAAEALEKIGGPRAVAASARRRPIRHRPGPLPRAPGVSPRSGASTLHPDLPVAGPGDA